MTDPAEALQNRHAADVDCVPILLEDVKRRTPVCLQGNAKDADCETIHVLLFSQEHESSFHFLFINLSEVTDTRDADVPAVCEADRLELLFTS